jgi:hypothetical protein
MWLRMMTAQGQAAYGQRFHISSTQAILPELPSEIKTAPPGYTKQTTCPRHGHLLAALLVCGSARIKSRHFPPKREIHGELGSAHAMNFGRNPKYLEVRSDSDATSDTGHSLASINNCPNRA